MFEKRKEDFSRVSRDALDTIILRIKTLFEETKTLKDRQRNIRRQNIRNLAIIVQAVREVRYGLELRRVSYGTV